MTPNWTNLHNHTVFSFLDGHSKPLKYVQRAKELGMRSACVTDHGRVHGILDFYDACVAEGVKPILGMEAYQARKTRFDRDEEERAGPSRNEWDQRGPYHLTVLAKNLDGYHNLIKLSSDAFTEGFYVKPRIDHELIDKYHDGLIVLSGCLSSEVQQALLRGDFTYAARAATIMQDIVGHENYFIEIHNHGIEDETKIHLELIQLAEFIGAPIVATGDCHYTNKEDAYFHDAMLCVSTGAHLDQENRFRFEHEEFYLKSYDEMLKRFEPEWLANSLAIEEMVELNLEFGELHFPSFPGVPEEKTPYEYLEEEVWSKVGDRYDEITQEVTDRINMELRVIKDMGFPEYFLVVADLVQWAKDNGIMVGWGRGSAAGSIISYILRITNLDPIKFNLMFERFLVEGRKSMPDIDLDFDDRYRDKVIEYAREKYGSDRVARIATFTTLGARGAIRDACRILNYPFAEGNKISNLIPPPVLGVAKSLEESVKLSSELRDLYASNDDVKKIIDTARGLEGIIRQDGIHAAGVIIAKTKVIDYVPVMQKGEGAPVVTQWDMDRAEQNGLLKIDFLSLRNLAVIDICVKNIKRYRDEDLIIDDIPIDDPEVFQRLQKGETNGIFQIESGGMTDMTLDLRPTNIYDIMALISLYRPGPMGSGMDKMYINRKHGREKVSDIHPALAEALKRSYGIMLYQEDVLSVCRILAGFSAGEADDVRKAVGKKLMDKIGLYRSIFVDGCKKNNNVSDALANKVYSDIEYFGGYGFNLAHAASYAMVAYVTAYLKVHYTHEYLAALMTSVVDSTDQLALYLQECRNQGITVLPPSINLSESEFSLDDHRNIVFGMLGIAGVGPAVVRKLFKDREKWGGYANLYDFYRKADPELINRTVMTHLTKAGAFDELVETTEEEPILLRKDKLELLDLEKQELGIYVTDHPLLEVWDFIVHKTNASIGDIKANTKRLKTVKLGGIIAKSEKKLSKNNKLFYVLQFEDLTDDIEVLIFTREASKINEGLISAGNIGILSATVQVEGDEENPRFKLFYNDFEKVNTLFLTGETPILLESPHKLNHLQLEKLCDIIHSKKGRSKVYLTYPEGPHTVTISFEEHVDKSMEDTLKQIVLLNSMNQEF